MTPQTFIFVGRSGAGKGTQVELFKKRIEESGAEVKSLVMGDIFRTFFKEEGYMQDVARDLSMNQGKFQPDFLTNALFISGAVKIVDEKSHLLLDGYPRTVNQLALTKELLSYIHRTNAIVVNIEVSREEVKKRMMLRGRGDDSESAIESRLGEYDRTVIPMLEAVKNDPFFTYAEINGEQSIEAVANEMKQKLAI